MTEGENQGTEIRQERKKSPIYPVRNNKRRRDRWNNPSFPPAEISIQSNVQTITGDQLGQAYPHHRGPHHKQVHPHRPMGKDWQIPAVG